LREAAPAVASEREPRARPGPQPTFAAAAWHLRELLNRTPVWGIWAGRLMKAASDSDARVAEMMCRIAATYVEQQRYDEAAPLLERVLDWRRAKLGPDHPATLESSRALGCVLLAAGRSEQALPLLKAAYGGLGRRLPAGHQRVAAAAGDLGECLLALRRYAEAEPLLRERFDVFYTRLGLTNEKTVGAVRALVRLYEAWGRPAQAAKWKHLLNE